jgi:D-serine deaminase-like pyridoxal phosphate-dependent protein
MSSETAIQPVTNTINVERYRLNSEAKVLTPALVIHRDLVAANIANTIRLLGGNANRWRPHVKTAKLAYVMRLLVAAGVPRFKCATGLELRTACEAGASDVVVAYPVVGANAARVRQIAGKFPQVVVSVLVENVAQLESWREGKVGVFVDVNPGMDRTGIPQSAVRDIVKLCRAIGDEGLLFRGLHYYDGHLSKYELTERFAIANRGYDQLLEIVAALDAAKIRVEEVTTAGTPAMPCSLAYPGFKDAGFVHRVSPGTVVYCDIMSLAQLPADYGYAPAVVVMTSVVSHPAADIITCDAGHKSVSADAGVPTCAVLGHPELEPMSPSEEHLPIRVNGGARRPAISEVLYLAPRHVCPTVNNFDHAVIAEEGSVLGVELVTARGREAPLAWAADSFLP